MNMQNTYTTFSSYLSHISIHFYEDTALMEAFGREFGIDVNRDSFQAVSFLYPSNLPVGYRAKEALEARLKPLTAFSPVNRNIPTSQFIQSDKGTVLLLAAHSREELSLISRRVQEEALKLLCGGLLDDGTLRDRITDGRILDGSIPNDRYSDKTLYGAPVRIGTGTVESGLAGMERTLQNAVTAVIMGEKFKKDRRILNYMDMEIYSAINAMVLAHGESLIESILRQLSPKVQTVLGTYYKCKEQTAATAAALQMEETEVRQCLADVKEKTGLDVEDTEDNFKLNFIMIAKSVLYNKIPSFHPSDRAFHICGTIRKV